MNVFNGFASSIVVSKNTTVDTFSFNDNLYENTGLYGQITWNDAAFYEGYSGFFITNTIDGSRNITNLDSLSNAILPLAQTINANYTTANIDDNGQIYHCQWTGYFKSDFTGTWSFSLTTVNYSMLWIGDSAINNDDSNVFLSDTGNDTLATTANIDLVSGKYYPIRIQWGKRSAYTNPYYILSVTRNATTITNLTSYLYSAKANVSTLIGIPQVFIKTTKDTNDNLYAPKLFVQYSESGYHNNVVNFVQNNPVYNGTIKGPSYVANIGTINEAASTLGFTIPTGNGTHDNFSMLYTGYFKADYTGDFSFNIVADDETYLWIGNYANSGYTTSNYLIKGQADGITRTGSIYLVNGTYYPIRLLYGQYTGPGSHTLTFTRNGQTITNWTGYTFHPITPTNGNPKMFIEEVIYIGGADSPLNAYFTDYYVNVPYGVNLDKYAGRYDVTSSSYFNNSTTGEIAKPFNVFKGNNAIVNGNAYTTWWGAGANNTGYESITEYSLSYTRNVYVGVYQGGGASTNTFSTTYYTTGTTTATASGEWIQISLPYNMKLTGYNARSRFTDCRVPVQYVILGSNDASTWYALDVVDIGTYVSYVPLKKYNINITTYPYANNYYNYFRYVIKKVDTSPTSTIATDRQYAHENQWNLIGIKQPITQDIVYIGGLSSPIKTYFTDYIINVPTIDGSLNKYGGNYAATASSIYGSTWIPSKLFNDAYTFSPATVEYSSWHSGGSGVASLKPMTNASLNYTQNPYNATTGIYIGGGNASLTYSTTYYTSGSTTATAAGEWVQIFVPYNMKLISYSNLSRYKYSRLPVQYVILGSTDGSTWYALDVVDIGTWDYYIPLKKYNINTTTYPYGNNYYCYFRYIIKKLDFKPGSGDRTIANEGQWNLVGLKESPINPDYLYIGGKYSPITSYFTNYLVNVPTGLGIDKYAGSYEINSSSYYNNNDGADYKVYNIFKGNTLMDSTYLYRTTWIAATDLGYGYKPITGAALNYSQTPYNNSNGTYVGGGNGSITYSTTYYTTGTTTATAAGEWAQINVPYSMKLISYNARSRYINMRLPVQYVILGSNDGTTWYALDEVDIGTWDNYIPMKNYAINTTTYPYATNYYSYFRYVIKKIDSNLSIANYDRKYVNENQWNLVGIKQTYVNAGKTIYIGANSPTGFTSYFTSVNVTVPSNFASPEYVGVYTITESSTSINPSNTYNLFLNDSTNDGQSYLKGWHSGYTGTNTAYINGSVVTYSQQPYVTATGNYQGGNTTTYKFGTSYYRTDNSIYYSGGSAFLGEWVQIKLPFRMKLTGYSNRTRYLDYTTLGRNPDYITIFGSNDGVIWYIVITSSNTVPLNVVNVDTTSFPDGKHGYSYFRWVINSLNKGDVANENQWNLIGVRTT